MNMISTIMLGSIAVLVALNQRGRAVNAFVPPRHHMSSHSAAARARSIQQQHKANERYGGLLIVDLQSESINTNLPPSPLLARRRQSADEDDDEYDDDKYIDEIINEKFDDFDDDEFDSKESDRKESDDGKFEYARVGRRRGRRGRDQYRDEEVEDAMYDNDQDATISSSRSSSRKEQPRSRDDEFGDEDDYYDDDEDFFDDEDDDEGEEYDEDILVPNPILDAIDPEGAADRIGELFVDPKWWKDAAAIAAVIVAVYLYTYDASDLIPWDSVTPDDFNLQGLYER